MIVIEHTVDLVNQGIQIIQETNGDITSYSLNGDFIETYRTPVPFSDYTSITEESWKKTPPQLSKGEIEDFVVKKLIKTGPYGFYTNTKGETFVKTPISVGGQLPKLTQFAVVDNVDSVNYVISTEISLYENFRLIFEQNNFRYEFVVNEKSGSIPKTPEMNGVFLVYCMGSRREATENSPLSEPIAVVLSQI